MDLRLLRYFVAVAEERHFGRAAARLHMTQPPLTRAVQQLEAELGATLLDRSPSGVTPTAAGNALYQEALALLSHAERIRARVAAASGHALTVGTLGDSIERAGSSAGTGRSAATGSSAGPGSSKLAGNSAGTDTGSGPGSLAAAFRQRHPGVTVRVVEADLADPTAGLRTGVVDVAVTRGPFDQTGISTRLIRSEPVGVVLRADDPLAAHAELRTSDLADRRWFRFPDGTDAVWSAYWSPAAGLGAREGPVVRTVHECIRAVLWDGIVGLAPFGGTSETSETSETERPSAHLAGPAEGLKIVPLTDMAPSPLIVAWRTGDVNPLLQSFIELAAP